MKFLCVLAAIVQASTLAAGANRSFTVDYEKNTFLKDGQPFRYISGCVHYFRIPTCYWRDRLSKMKAGGLDAIETYIPWNFHWEKGGFNFKDQHDIVSFLTIAQEEGLLAIIRGLPYSDTEWDMGGLPYWLLRSEYNPPGKPMALRTADPKFVSAVDDWLSVLLPLLKPLLYNNGGPIIMVQVENEYGSYYAHDATYMKSLYASINSKLDENVVLFTTDGNVANDLKYGGVPGALQTVDFGPGSDPKASFEVLRKFQPNGPVVNSEFYTGWLDHWGESGHHRTSAEAICATFDKMLQLNASVNFYMFTGGTNFGYWSGSNSPPFQQITTSYDYDSPISENGDTTNKFFQIRDIISKYKTLPTAPIPANITTIKYGLLDLTNKGSVWDHLDVLCSTGPIRGSHPISYEDLSMQGGYVLYRVNASLDAKFIGKPLMMTFEEGIRDSAQIYVNQSYVGTLVRGNNTISLGTYKAAVATQIDLILEARGRVCYGSHINDSKGISGIVKLTADGHNSMILNNWMMYPFELEKLTPSAFKEKPKSDKSTLNVPTIYTNTLYTPTVADTFIDFSGGNWTSGHAIANGFNLGKYEPKSGPQKALYLPTKAVLQDDPSVGIVVLETLPSTNCSNPGKSCSINFVDRPKLG